MALAQLQSLPYNLANDYAFAVVPTFVFMGNLAMGGGMARELYAAADRWFGHLRGGLYLSTIAGSAAFGAASGSTLVNATVFTRVALPEMLRLGYSKKTAPACIASVGTLDAMIPPSVAMVVYGIITETSIGKLMVAGLLPGILAAVAYCVLMLIMVRLRPELAPQRMAKASWRERFVFPIANAAGLDPIWFGILCVQLLEIGAITPPVGLNLYATVSASNGTVSMEEIVEGIVPFVALNLVILAALVAFPGVVTWLPAQMKM